MWKNVPISGLISFQLISSTRVALPAFDPAELEKLLITFVATDGPKWLPRSRPGTSLYLRPTMIGSAGALGVSAPKEAMLFIISTFVSSSVTFLNCIWVNWRTG